MLNQRKLYISVILSFMMVAVITIVAVDSKTGMAVQNPGIATANIEDETNAGERQQVMMTVEDTEEKEQEQKNEEKAEETMQMPKQEPVAFEQEEESRKEAVQTVETESIWKEAYYEMKYGELSMEKLAAQALAKMKNEELALMSSATDHIVNYHGTRFAITDDEYQVLLRIVEAEAPEEDIVGRMLVANVILNRVHAKQFPNTITEVVFEKGQFSPISDGMYFKRTPSELTKEAVDRVLAGEDKSQGALYFVARKLTTKKAMKFFDEKLDFLFKHGVHEFFTEK